MMRLTKWGATLTSLPETGMGYQIATVKLSDGRQFRQALIVEGQLTKIRGIEGIPFSEDEIADIVVTHERWNFAEKT